MARRKERGHLSLEVRRNMLKWIRSGDILKVTP